VRAFLDKRFIQPTKSNNVKEKNIFDSRIHALAKTIMVKCKDDDCAVMIVREGTNISKQVFPDRNTDV